MFTSRPVEMKMLSVGAALNIRPYHDSGIESREIFSIFGTFFRKQICLWYRKATLYFRRIPTWDLPGEKE